MLILITYDVDTISVSGQKRLRQVAKICKNYGQRVQNSVFECEVTESQFVGIKHLLSSVIDIELDSIRIYRLGKKSNIHTIILGKITSYDVNDVLMI